MNIPISLLFIFSHCLNFDWSQWVKEYTWNLISFFSLFTSKLLTVTWSCSHFIYIFVWWTTRQCIRLQVIASSSLFKNKKIKTTLYYCSVYIQKKQWLRVTESQDCNYNQLWLVYICIEAKKGVTCRLSYCAIASFVYYFFLL